MVRIHVQNVSQGCILIKTKAALLANHALVGGIMNVLVFRHRTRVQIAPQGTIQTRRVKRRVKCVRRVEAARFLGLAEAA